MANIPVTPVVPWTGTGLNPTITGGVNTSVATPAPASTITYPNGQQGTAPLPTYSTTNPAPAIPGVSQAVANAAYNAGYSPTTSTVNSSTISGSPSTQQNQNTTTSMNQGVATVTGQGNTSITTVAPDAPQNMFNTATGQLNPNFKPTVPTQNPTTGIWTMPDGSTYDPKTQTTTPASTAGGTTDPATGNTTYPSGLVVDKTGNIVKAPSTTAPPPPTVVSVSGTDSYGGYTATMSDGSTQYVAPPPATASLYASKSAADTQAQTSANDRLAQENQNYNQTKQQLTEQMDNATAGAQASYATDNPEGAGSDQEEYLASVQKPFAEQLANLEANHTLAVNSINDNLSATLQNNNVSLQSGLATAQNNTITQGQNNYTTWETSVAGDGTDDPTVGAAALMQANANNPAYTYQMAMATAQGKINAVTLKTNTTLGTQAREDATAASNAFYKAIGDLTTPFDQLPQAAQLGYIDQYQQAHPGASASEAASVIESLNKGVVAAQKTKDDEANAITRLDIAQKNANTSKNKGTVDDVTKSVSTILSVNKDALNAQSPTQLANTIASIATMSNVNPSMVFGYVQAIASTLPASTQKIVNAPGFFAKFFGGTTTSTIGIVTPNSQNSSSNSDNSSGDSTSSGNSYTVK